MAAGVLGVGQLGELVLGAGANSLSDDQVDVAYLLCIEGLPYCWVTDHTDDVLLGGGSNSWIGQYEQDSDFTAHETVGQRTVLAGLKIPSQLPKGRLNPKTGQLESTQVAFDLLDADGILPGLFASEDKDFNVLGQRVAPGTSALSNSLIVEGANSIDPVDRYLGIERIGPARERAWFYPFPFAGIGGHHQVNVNAPADSQGPPPVRISEEPLEFAGRKVVLHKLFRNGSGAAASRDEWPHWGDQHRLGPPEFVGVMRDVGEYRGDRTWRVQCFGIESLLRRRMGTFDAGWTTIASAGVALTDAQRQIGVAFYAVDSDYAVIDYGSVVFGTRQLSTTETKSGYAAEVSGIVIDVGDGTTPADFGGSPMFDEDFTGSTGVAFAMESTGAMQIRRSADGTAGMVYVRLCLHERVWRALGYEPALQSVSWAHAPSKFTEVVFQSLDAGDAFADPTGGGFGLDGTGAPGPGYWVALVHTAAPNHAPQTCTPDEMDNDGAWRRFEPLFSSQPIILGRPAGEQDVRLSASFPYVEPDPTIDPGSYDAARYFVLRGRRAVGEISDAGQIFTESGELVEDLEAEEFAAVAEVRWDLQGSTYGSIEEPSSGPSVALYRWISSRRFGVDHDDIQKTGEWSALPSGEYSIEVAPLRAYAYREDPAADDDGIERAFAVFGQLLLSTGTASGWSGGSYSAGVNEPTTNPSTFWINDVVGSELGLGIPRQLVQSSASILSAFDDVEGGAHGSLSRVRYAYSEPFQSQDLLDSLLRPRGLAMSLRGGRFGATKLGLFEPTEVDAVIDESSVALRSLEDPSSIPTTQQLRATGGLDLVVLQAGLDPSTGEHVYAQTLPARDPGSRFRRGDIEENITATGLLDPAWGVGGSGWLGQARELHSVERAKWLNQRHFLIRTTLHRIAGENLWPGSRVSFTSERVYTAAGELGMSSALGHVLSVTARPQSQEYDVEIIVYAGQLRLSLFAPIGKVESFSGTTVQLAVDADFLDHGEGLDANRFVRPSWLALETAATVCLLEYDRRDWTLHSGDTSTVAGVSGHVVTLDSAFTGFHAHRDYYLVLVGFDDQVEGSWPRAACLPYVLDTLQFGGGPTDGWPFLDG